MEEYDIVLHVKAWRAYRCQDAKGVQTAIVESEKEALTQYRFAEEGYSVLLPDGQQLWFEKDLFDSFVKAGRQI